MNDGDEIENRLESLSELREESTQLLNQIDDLSEKHDEVMSKHDEVLVGALEYVQEALGENGAEYGEEVELVQVEEFGRVSSNYKEVLTPGGVETKSYGRNDWEGAISVEEYLERTYRGTNEHKEALVGRLEELADGVENPDGDLPTYPVPVNG